MKKYIIDTNIIIQYPNFLDTISKSQIVIHEKVLSELDNFKNKKDLNGKNSRTFTRILSNIIEKNIKTYNKNKIEFVSSNLKDKVDDELLQYAKDNNCILLTNDLNLKLKCTTNNVKTEKFEFKSFIEEYKGYDTIECDETVIDNIFKIKHYKLPKRHNYKMNQYVIFKSPTKTCYTKYTGNGCLKLFPKNNTFSGIKPINDNQYLLYDALVNSNVRLVAVSGISGTGKTLLSLAYSLAQFKNKNYDHIFISKTLTSVGGNKNDMGFLPGTVEEKLYPVFSSFFDSYEFICKNTKDKVESKNCLEFLPITYLRGRSLENSIVILDECQNCNLNELKTLITRAGHNTKIILLADINQIDDVKITKFSNGFSEVIEKFLGQDIFSYIQLEQCERSKLSKLGATLL